MSLYVISKTYSAFRWSVFLMYTNHSDLTYKYIQKQNDLTLCKWYYIRNNRDIGWDVLSSCCCSNNKCEKWIMESHGSRRMRLCNLWTFLLINHCPVHLKSIASHSISHFLHSWYTNKTDISFLKQCCFSFHFFFSWFYLVTTETKCCHYWN